ncbi:MAG: sugar ABC transporter permease, partial [Lachnospiraceae bacterium]|nr:sugar ABC transporter permease [Lachnospiraceae bacterium]
TALLSVIIMTVWKNAGYAMLFYIGALGRVPEELYEAAAIDGSGKIKKFFGITLPLVSPTTLLLMIMLTIQSLQAYDQIQVLTQGGPSGSTRTLLYRYYQLAFEQFNMGEASANVVALLILTVLLSVLQLWVSKRYVHYQ